MLLVYPCSEMVSLPVLPITANGTTQQKNDALRSLDRSALGPVFGVYFVFLVAVLCFVQSKLSVSSWVNKQMLPSSNPQ